MAFTYYNERLKYCIDKMIKELKDTCDGKNISISDLTKDADGYYSEELFCGFIEELVSKGISDDAQDIEHQRDYLETLLYVVIRSMQAKIQYHPVAAHGKPVASDTFLDLIHAFDGMTGWPAQFTFTSGGMKDTRNHLLAANMEGTARSVYYYVAGEDLEFPDPYQMAAGQEEVENAPQETVLKNDYYSYHYGDEKSSLASAKNDEEMRKLYEEQAGDKYVIDPSSGEESKALYEKQVKRVRTFFPYKDEYAAKYRHLIEITGPGDQKYTYAIPAKVEAYLKDHDLTAYSDEEITDKVFDHLHAAAREVNLWQGKKI